MLRQNVRWLVSIASVAYPWVLLVFVAAWDFKYVGLFRVLPLGPIFLLSSIIFFCVSFLLMFFLPIWTPRRKYTPFDIFKVIIMAGLSLVISFVSIATFTIAPAIILVSQSLEVGP